MWYSDSRFYSYKSHFVPSAEAATQPRQPELVVTVDHRCDRLVEVFPRDVPLIDPGNLPAIPSRQIALILGHRTASFSLLCFRINVLFGLFNDVESNRERDAFHLIVGGEKLKAFNVTLKSVTPMPGDDVVLIGVGLLADAVINADSRLRRLDGTHQRFDDLPQVSAVLGGEATNRVT